MLWVALQKVFLMPVRMGEDREVREEEEEPNWKHCKLTLELNWFSLARVLWNVSSHLPHPVRVKSASFT